MSAIARSSLVPHGDRFRLVLGASALGHAAALTAALLLRPAPIIDLEQKPIAARLVRLGEKRPENLLPRKEEPPPPPAPPPEAVPAPSPRAQATPAPRTPAPPSPRRDAFASALTRIRREQALSPPTGGDPSGDPLGDASEGDAGDRYLAMVQRALQDNYRVPATISDADRVRLRATVVLYVEQDGRISHWSFESRSGSTAYDDALERTIRQTRLPPPPDDRREEYRRRGLAVRFHI